MNQGYLQLFYCLVMWKIITNLEREFKDNSLCSFQKLRFDYYFFVALQNIPFHPSLDVCMCTCIRNRKKDFALQSKATGGGSLEERVQKNYEAGSRIHREEHMTSSVYHVRRWADSILVIFFLPLQIWSFNHESK